MHSTLGSDHRSRVWIAARVFLSLTLAALIALWGAQLARADGDPASDVLAQQRLFLPQDAGLSPSAQTQLAALVEAATRAGYQIRVAVIASSSDLGSVTELWGQPQSYAKFLGQELSLVYHGDVLVVMPSGVGVYSINRPTAAEPSPLAGMQAGGGTGGLSGLASSAVERLAAAAGHPVTAPAGVTAAGGHRSADVTAWIVFVLGASLIALAWGASLRARPPRSSRAPSPAG
jgi:hypothetical protein